jgi:asparagine synthase (glutamine-hydrolysing)
MTAIHGLWRFDGHDPTSDFKRMELPLSRYGSDDYAIWTPDPAIRMGRQLHCSLPEDHLRAPAAPKSRYVVVGDVRLTERDDLARQLNLGSNAVRMSDSAIAATAIETWHEEAFDRIYGDFAIAAWDRRERRLLLARDHLGRKPLFFYRGDRFLAFATMPVGLHALPEVPRGPDIDSIKRFLAQDYLARGKTHYEGIARVMPGHYAVITSSSFSETRYWKPDLTPLRLVSTDDYADALAEHFDRAVAAVLRGAETKVGAHLSSGLDSTAVATTAARLLAQTRGTVIAYTASPREGYDQTRPNRLADESGLARATAAMHPNMQHVVIRSDRTPVKTRSHIGSIYGLPALNLCNETWFDAINDDAAERGITVMLEAAMGNATISETGILALPMLIRSGRVVAWLKLVRDLARKGLIGWPSIFWNSFNFLIPNALYHRLLERKYGAMVMPSRHSGLKHEHWRAVIRDAVGKSSAFRSNDRALAGAWLRGSTSSLTNRLRILEGDDVGASLKGILGEWKIDYRDPTADRRLVEFSLRVPAEELIHGGEPRALIRQVLAERAPREVLDNRRRGYQAADWHEWLDKAREDVNDEIARIEMFDPTAELIDVARLRSLVDNWPQPGSREWNDADAIADYRCCLLRSISAASFMRQAAGSNY